MFKKKWNFIVINNILEE